MQQTTTYKLNLIETDDVFSPEPLNQNTQKVEAVLADAAQALADETAARQSADAAGTAAWQSAVSAEATARQNADTAEATARQNAIASEAATRQNAIAAETAARQSAIAAEASARQSAVAALDNRLKVFEARRVASGTYTANNSQQAIEFNLGFTPKLVFVHGINGNQASGMLLPGDKGIYDARIVTNGFIIPAGYDYYLNYMKCDYMYLAFA